MGILSPSFLFGLVILFYLFSFVVFAIIRIATGISIQRLGYFSLRHIVYTPQDGLRIDLRGLGLHLHRPTFAQPTWLSLRLTELKVTVDLTSFGGGKKEAGEMQDGQVVDRSKSAYDSTTNLSRSNPRKSNQVPPRSQTWTRLTKLKEQIKRLHSKIDWICLVDVELLNTSCVITDIGSLHIGSLAIAVDTRRETVDRGRLFRHKKTSASEQRPAEWMFVVKSILFTPEGQKPLEILDICSLNIHGSLYRDVAGLRDASISLKLGRIRIPYDDILTCQSRINRYRSVNRPASLRSPGKAISLTDVVEELDMPGSREEGIVQTVSDSKDFISSTLRGIQEIQLAVSFIGMSKKIHSAEPTSPARFLNFSMNEFGIDLFRLDPKSPAHRMYFSSEDIAHQALLAAISIAVSVDDGIGKPERLLYVPMATVTVKTTLPSKTVAISEDKDAADRNANILFANLVVTSPSIDLDLKHIPVVIALMQFDDGHSKPAESNDHRHHLISRLLPKASIKISIQEPVARIVLPPMNTTMKCKDEYDLLISSVSSISLDTESSHSSAGDLHYALTSNLRVSSQQLYYQSASGDRHSLLTIDALELKGQISATSEVSVVVSGNIQTFSIHMVRPEIIKGVHQIVEHSSTCSKSTKPRKSTAKDRSLLRRLPSSIVQVQVQGSNFGIELAGVDPNVSMGTRGVAFQMESWNTEYRIQKDIKEISVDKRLSSLRTFSNSVSGDESSCMAHPSDSSSPKKAIISTDGRRLATQVRGFEGFVVEGIGAWEPEPFVSLPRFEVTLSTSSDAQGAILHVRSHIKALYVQYSLYRSYAIGLASQVLKEAFLSLQTASTSEQLSDYPTDIDQYHARSSAGHTAFSELTTVEVKAAFIQVKATMPSDPPVMLQVYGVEAGRHRWAVPFMRSRLTRLFAEAPKFKAAWARIASVKNVRLDLRESRKKVGKLYLDQRSIDLTTDFIRLAVPHQLVPHKIFDNFVNIAKATEQLHHRFNTGEKEYMLEKGPENPKRVPRISIHSKVFMLELEDGIFDWKLGLIYRVGLTEQKQRLAREDAYNLKIKKLQEYEQRRGWSRYRTQSSHAKSRERSKPLDLSDTRDQSTSGDGRPRRLSTSRSDYRGRRMRYDPECANDLTGAAQVTAQEAWRQLAEYNAQSWKKRINLALHHEKNKMREFRGVFWGHDDLPDSIEESETIVAMPERPGLMSALISDLHIIVDKPSFSLDEYPKYLHDVGKGIPLNMQYSLLIPMNLEINMGEARVTLRDYPLPLLHVPAIKPGQSPRLPSWSIKTDFVIAEEYRNVESMNNVQVEIIPPRKFNVSENVENSYSINVRRTVSPVKTYSNVDIAINTGNPTSITWGTSYQPAIQDMMQIIEGFTKPQADPSERTGFWDKIRLSVHSRVNVAWKGDGDVHLKLKGLRDPYNITGQGAGFIMCFRNNVRWGIHQDDDPKKFMTVNSGEYVLAIPNYDHKARRASYDSTQADNSTLSTEGIYKNRAIFKKTIMKLSGNVRWLAGLVFERDLDGGGRSFDFIPHYKITLKTPHHAKKSVGQTYDAFRGFRSQYIHLSVAVVAPLNRSWSVTNLKPSNSYNSIHLTPRFFTHFFSWWSLFSGIMSLPVRQGKLFPGVEKSSKKFGRHLASIKYNLLLSPLFIAHIYKHKDAEDYSENSVGATGLKLRLDSFMLDLHQRREEFPTQVKGRGKQTKTSGMRINEVQLDFITADIRAVSAIIAGTSQEDVSHATDEDLVSYYRSAVSPDVSRFTIPDQDYLWIDMDDFVELDWILPSEVHPETSILPLAFAPRFTYFRKTDHHEMTKKTSNRSSPFGNEDTHFCIMTKDNDPQKVQCDLIKERIAVIDEQIETHGRTLGEQELRVVRDGFKDSSLKTHHEMLKQQGKILQDKKGFMQSMLRRLTQQLEESQLQREVNEAPAPNRNQEDRSASPSSLKEKNNNDTRMIFTDIVSDFNNRFIIHNIQLKWSNSLRNIILRYVHQVSQRRGFVYYMSRRAVKFILDIVEEQNKNRHKQHENSKQHTPTTQPSPSVSFVDEDSEFDLDERIHQILQDGKSFVNADDPLTTETPPRPNTGNLRQDISEEFVAQNSYHVRLIAPQIQLQSEKNAKAVLIVTAKGMQLKVIQIMDKDRIADDVSGLVQRRFSVDMDGVQFFVSNQKNLTQFFHLYSANRYGSPKGSAWPPWVPLEVNFDFHLNPFGFSRVVQKTSASLRYDKYNTLRLKYNDEVNKGDPKHAHHLDDPESRMDHLWVEFPHIRAICDSAQYYAMYLIVIDLLLYSEPLEKIRSERLEKIMLVADFSDLTGAPEMVVSLQERITQLEEIKEHFQLHAKELDRQGWRDRLSIEQDLTNCEDELFFMMKAITTAQRKNDDRSQAVQSNGILRWYLSASEIVWHLMREKNEPLMEIQLKHAAYERTDNSDGSNNNTMEIQRLHGLNLLPDALYPQMLAPYFEKGQFPERGKEQDIKMFRVQWLMLEAIAGIPVLDQFEVNLFPLKVQLEREIGKKLFDYIFPGSPENRGASPFMIKHMPAVQDEDEESDNGPTSPLTPLSTPEAGDATIGAGSLKLRLKPTLELPSSNTKPGSVTSGKPRSPGLPGMNGESHKFKLFRGSNRSKSANRAQATTVRPSANRTLSRRQSGDSMHSLARSTANGSSLTLSSMNGSADKPRRFALRRTGSNNSIAEKDKASDDLTQMMSRASEYMTLAYVKIPSVVLCLSYKGRGDRNIEDVHNFVFRMPALEYRNKTWSNLDLALRLKKDVIRALISHTGAIIGNKFSHHRPNKHQRSRLREIATTSSLLPSTDVFTNTMIREPISLHGRSRSGDRTGDAPNGYIAGWGTEVRRSRSYASSLDNMISPGDRNTSSSRGRDTVSSSTNMSIITPTRSEDLSSEPSIIPESESEMAEENIVEQNMKRFKQNSFSRRLTNDTQRTWVKDKDGNTSRKDVQNGHGHGEKDEQEGKSQRPSILSLGKKILGTVT